MKISFLWAFLALVSCAACSREPVALRPSPSLPLEDDELPENDLERQASETIEPKKEEEAPQFQLKEEDLDEDGFPRKELLPLMPEEERKRWERHRYQKESADRYLRFESPDRNSEAYRREASLCTPMPPSWGVPRVPGPYECKQCKGAPRSLPECKGGGDARPLTAALLEAVPKEAISVRARLRPSRTHWVGTMARASYSRSLLLAGTAAEVLLLLDTENLSPLLDRLTEGPWVSQTGSISCSGVDELCCPFQVGPEKEGTEVVAQGRLEKLDEFYPNGDRQYSWSFVVQSLCLPERSAARTTPNPE